MIDISFFFFMGSRISLFTTFYRPTYVRKLNNNFKKKLSNFDLVTFEKQFLKTYKRISTKLEEKVVVKCSTSHGVILELNS